MMVPAATLGSAYTTWPQRGQTGSVLPSTRRRSSGAAQPLQNRTRGGPWWWM